MKAVLKYPGSKRRIAPWIVKRIPKHHAYLEPFAGSLAVLFNKPPSPIEMVRDIDNNVVNVFQCIKKDSQRLASIIGMTPYARKVYDDTFELPVPVDEFERAVWFLIQCWQGHGFRTNGYKVGWKNDVQGREDMYACKNWYRLPNWIVEITDRLKQVQIDNAPFNEIIPRFKFKNVFIYCDPPYILSTRSGKQYKHEMSNDEHVELLELLLQHPGPVILSGYENDLYNSILKDWRKDYCIGYAEYYGGRQRTEVIWMNYDSPAEQMKISEVMG